MKRTAVVLRPYAGAGSALLMVSLLLLAGCSGGDAGGQVAGKYGLERSEFIALKKASTDHRDLKNAQMKRKIEKWQEQGVVGVTAPAGKKMKKNR
jgi:hypothetical protein